jgi:hypothetical protein
MYLPLTENYIATAFFQNCGKPFYNRAQRTYQGSCPICREGKSWLKKRRCYYIVEKNAICCHNCGWYSNPYQWIVKVTNKSFKQIKEELESFSSEVIFDDKPIQYKEQVKNEEILPLDSINLFDRKQVLYYSQNPIVKQCLETITTRRLDKAINRPSSLYTTLTDKIHNNRLIIPFYNNNKIIFYQSRSVDREDTRPKYLSKVLSEKSLFGVDNIDVGLEFIFILEGPIDAMFVKNGVAVAGINESSSKNFTETQSQQLNQYPLHKKVWVLDNQRNDNASKLKTNKLLDIGETVFIWPENLSNYKDINEYCIDNGVDSLDTETIINNSYSGLKGKLLVSNY